MLCYDSLNSAKVISEELTYPVGYTAQTQVFMRKTCVILIRIEEPYVGSVVHDG